MRADPLIRYAEDHPLTDSPRRGICRGWRAGLDWLILGSMTIGRQIRLTSLASCAG